MNKQPEIAIAAILAGGLSRRMGNLDKAELTLNGRRLIDHVIERIVGQVNDIFLSASHNYQSDFLAIADEPGMLAGPVAGIWAIASMLEKEKPHIQGFFTVPVDAPSIPLDLIEKLQTTGYSAIVKTPSGLQPTFAYWDITTVLCKLREVKPSETLSLQKLAMQCEARHIDYSTDTPFANINTLEDLKELEDRLSLERKITDEFSS